MSNVKTMRSRPNGSVVDGKADVKQ
jgi:hypothetical protein